MKRLVMWWWIEPANLLPQYMPTTGTNGRYFRKVADAKTEEARYKAVKEGAAYDFAQILEYDDGTCEACACLAEKEEWHSYPDLDTAVLAMTLKLS